MGHGDGYPTDKLRDLKCQKCGPKAGDCNDLVLAARCHTGAGVDVSAHGECLAILCHECSLLVVELKAPATLDVSGVPLHEHSPSCQCGGPIHVVEPPCHPDSAVDVLYQKSTHSLSIRCKDCHTVRGSIPLGSSPAIN
jgi:hypothetical protein